MENGGVPREKTPNKNSSGRRGKPNPPGRTTHPGPTTTAGRTTYGSRQQPPLTRPNFFQPASTSSPNQLVTDSGTTLTNVQNAILANSARGTAQGPGVHRVSEGHQPHPDGQQVRKEKDGGRLGGIRLQPPLQKQRLQQDPKSLFEILSVIYFNARSLFKKLDELIAVINFYKPDLVMICETWLNINTSNSMLSIDGYYIVNELRRDRQDTRMGASG